MLRGEVTHTNVTVLRGEVTHTNVTVLRGEVTHTNVTVLRGEQTITITPLMFFYSHFENWTQFQTTTVKIIYNNIMISF